MREMRAEAQAALSRDISRYREVVRELNAYRRENAHMAELPRMSAPVSHGFEESPGSTPMDHFGLVKAVDRLGQSVVVAVADAADRGLDPGLCQTFGIFDRQILAAVLNIVAATNRQSRLSGQCGVDLLLKALIGSPCP